MKQFRFKPKLNNYRHKNSKMKMPFMERVKNDIKERKDKLKQSNQIKKITIRSARSNLLLRFAHK